MYTKMYRRMYRIIKGKVLINNVLKAGRKKLISRGLAYFHKNTTIPASSTIYSTEYSIVHNKVCSLLYSQVLINSTMYSKMISIL